MCEGNNSLGFTLKWTFLYNYIFTSIFGDWNDLQPCLLWRHIMVTWMVRIRMVAIPPATPTIVQILSSSQARSFSTADILALPLGGTQSISTCRSLDPTEFLKVSSIVTDSIKSHRTVVIINLIWTISRNTYDSLKTPKINPTGERVGGSEVLWVLSSLFCEQYPGYVGPGVPRHCSEAHRHIQTLGLRIIGISEFLENFVFYF